MKNVIIVLLVAAVGAGVYFYFSRNQNQSLANSEELIIGKWKIDSLVINNDSSELRDGLLSNLLDSSLNKYQFEFRADSFILQTYNGKPLDSSRYVFAGNKNLFIWGNPDTSKTKWNVDRLDSTILILKDADSATFYFQRLE